MSESRNDPVKGLVILVACFVILWIFSWWAIVYFIQGWNDRGSFGDMFGSVNALFSGAALAGVIYAIFLQRRELQLQRHELELTRNELQRSAAAQEKSEEALRKQVDALLMTSKLNSINSLLVGYTTVLEMTKVQDRSTLKTEFKYDQEYFEKVKHHISILEAYLTEIDKNELSSP